MGFPLPLLLLEAAAAAIRDEVEKRDREPSDRVELVEGWSRNAVAGLTDDAPKAAAAAGARRIAAVRRRHDLHIDRDRDREVWEAIAGRFGQKKRVRTRQDQVH